MDGASRGIAAPFSVPVAWLARHGRAGGAGSAVAANRCGPSAAHLRGSCPAQPRSRRVASCMAGAVWPIAPPNCSRAGGRKTPADAEGRAREGPGSAARKNAPGSGAAVTASPQPAARPPEPPAVASACATCLLRPPRFQPPRFLACRWRADSRTWRVRGIPLALVCTAFSGEAGSRMFSKTAFGLILNRIGLKSDRSYRAGPPIHNRLRPGIATERRQGLRICLIMRGLFLVRVAALMGCGFVCPSLSCSVNATNTSDRQRMSRWRAQEKSPGSERVKQRPGGSALPRAPPAKRRDRIARDDMRSTAGPP